MIYRENEMDPVAGALPEVGIGGTAGSMPTGEQAGVDDGPPEAFVLFERGTVEQRVVHDEDRIEQRRMEREREAFAQRYAQRRSMRVSSRSVIS